MADPLISFSGIASGIDSKSIVAALVAFRARPISLLEKRRADFQLLKSRYQFLKERVSAVRDAADDIKKSKDFLSFNATSSKENAVSATVDGTAALGSISVKVNALAKAEVEQSNGYADFDTTSVGTGTITVTVGGTANNLVLDPTSNTLQDVRDAINDADIGVSAQVINTGIGSTPYQLVVTADETGVANTVTIDTTTSFTGSLTFTETIAAANADLDVNGINFQRESNAVNDIITGVTFNLTNTTTGTETVTVSTDLDDIKAKIQKYVDAQSELVNFINSQIAVSDAGVGGPFNGESTVRTLKDELLNLNALGAFPGGSISALSDIGISLNSDGTLAFDTGKFEDAAIDNLDDVTSLLTTKGDFLKGDVGFQIDTVPGEITAGDYAVSITQAATKATGASSSAFAGPLAQAEVLTITVGTADPITVNLDAGDEIADAVKSINDALSAEGLSLSASDNGGTIEFTADEFGSDFGFSVSSDLASGGSGVDAAGVAGTGLDVIGTISGLSATGKGQFLTGTGAGTEDIKLKYTGSSVASSTLTVGPDGFFLRVEELLSTALTPINGKIEGRLGALDESIDGINDRIDSLTLRLDTYKKQLEKKFSSLEQLLGTLQASQSFLAISQAQLVNGK